MYSLDLSIYLSIRLFGGRMNSEVNPDEDGTSEGAEREREREREIAVVSTRTLHSCMNREHTVSHFIFAYRVRSLPISTPFPTTRQPPTGYSVHWQCLSPLSSIR
jgi:hypothetical protein